MFRFRKSLLVASTRALHGSILPDRAATLPLTCCLGRRLLASKSAVWLTDEEEASAKLLDAVQSRVAQFQSAQDSPGESVQEQKERSKIMKDLGPLADAYRRYETLRQAILEIEPHLSDPEESIRDMFASEKDDLLQELDEALSRLPRLLLPTPEAAELPAMISINAGVGGSEAALFAMEMARAYTRFASKRGWKVDTISESKGPDDVGVRETTIKIEPPAYCEEDDDKHVYGSFQWEKGVHRVQRVPATETQGRVHTSTITVIVNPIYPDKPEAPLVDVKDVKTDVMRAGGAGGQHVNKTESAVRLTHLPTGITVSMQDSRSQHQNRAWAWEILRARLSELKHQEAIEARRAARQSQVKSANRSDKVRTYNFPQDRVTDHRIGQSFNGIKEILEGERLEVVIETLREDFNSRRLESILLGEGDLDE